MKLTPAIAQELLSYSPSTGKLYWNKRGAPWFNHEKHAKAWASQWEGKEAGCVRTLRNGYTFVVIDVLGDQHLAHRIAWMIMTGGHPPEMIDHKNRNPTDNRWANLRNGEKHNRFNLSMYRNNSSGVTGVYWDKGRNKWRASCKRNGKTYRLGGFDSLRDAENALLILREKLGFSHGHGTRKPFRDINRLRRLRCTPQRQSPSANAMISSTWPPPGSTSAASTLIATTSSADSSANYGDH